MKSIRWIKVKLQEMIKPSISNKYKNILGIDRVEQFMQRRNVEVSLVLPHYSGYTRGAHELLLTHSHSENSDLVHSTDMSGWGEYDRYGASWERQHPDDWDYSD